MNRNDDLVEAWQATLRQLELKQAQYGIDTPLNVLNGIELARREIARLQVEQPAGDPNGPLWATNPTTALAVRVAVLQEQVQQLRHELHNLMNNGHLGRLEGTIHRVVIAVVMLSMIELSTVGFLLYQAVR
jgi:hypothetical protein